MDSALVSNDWISATFFALGRLGFRVERIEFAWNLA